MNLEVFLSLKGDHFISHEDAKSLNDCLAKVAIQDIPLIHRDRVADYLTTALNMNSMTREISQSLDLLLLGIKTHV